MCWMVIMAREGSGLISPDLESVNSFLYFSFGSNFWTALI